MLNQIAIVGRLTKEVEIFQNDNGDQMVAFGIAFKQGRKPDGSEDTGFIEVKTFGKLANTCAEWLSKGDKVAIGGRIYNRKFTRKDGSNASVHELIANEIEFIDILKTSEESEEPEGEAEEEQELPFEPAPEVKVTPKPQNAKPVAKTTRTRR